MFHGVVTVGLDWRLDDKYVERIRAVTPEQVREVARKYLAEDRLTVAMLDPQPIEPGHPIFEGPVGGADVH